MSILWWMMIEWTRFNHNVKQSFIVELWDGCGYKHGDLD